MIDYDANAIIAAQARREAARLERERQSLLGYRAKEAERLQAEAEEHRRKIEMIARVYGPKHAGRNAA